MDERRTQTNGSKNKYIDDLAFGLTAEGSQRQTVCSKKGKRTRTHLIQFRGLRNIQKKPRANKD